MIVLGMFINVAESRFQENAMRLRRAVTPLVVALLAISACATSAPAPVEEAPAAGIRREPCGGGPVFPPEESAPAPQEEPGR